MAGHAAMKAALVGFAGLKFARLGSMSDVSPWPCCTNPIDAAEAFKTVLTRLPRYQSVAQADLLIIGLGAAS